MDNKLLNILQSKEVPIDNQQIIDYLKGELNVDTQHQLEKQELESAFVHDGIEGLQLIADKAKLEMITREMHFHLQKKLNTHKNKHKEKRKWKDQTWIILSIITVLLLIIISYLIMKTILK